MLDKDSILVAIQTGHKSSSVLQEILEHIVKDVVYCPNVYNDYASLQDCGECVVCIAKEIINKG